MQLTPQLDGVPRARIRAAGRVPAAPTDLNPALSFSFSGFPEWSGPPHIWLFWVSCYLVDPRNAPS